MQQAGEPSFRESVDLMFNRAARLMDLSPGLEQKIRFGYLKYQGRPLIPGLLSFLDFLEGALEKDHRMI